jgi:tetratricopeptide (TPR) repeat protein
MNDDYLEGDKVIISVDLLYENAKKEISDSNYTNAIELLTSCLNISSEYIYKHKSSIDKEHMRKLNTLTIKLLNDMSFCYFNLNQYHECIEIDKQILSVNKNNEQSYIRLIQSFHKLNDISNVEKYFKEYSSIFTINKDNFKDIIEYLNKNKKEEQHQHKTTTITHNTKVYKQIIPMLIGVILGFYLYCYKHK